MDTNKSFSIISEEEMKMKLAQINKEQPQQSNKKSLEKKDVFRELALGLLISAGISGGTIYVARSDLIHDSQPQSSSEIGEKNSSDVLEIDKMIKDREMDMQVNNILQERITELEEIINIQDQIIEAQEQKIQNNDNTPKLQKLPFLDETQKKKKISI